MNRREFLVSSAALAIAPLPSLAEPPRDPFLEVMDVPDFLYFEQWDRPNYAPTGPLWVAAVGEWNGKGYPISLRSSRKEYFDGLDSEWCMFRKEVPGFSWRSVPEGRYPNIHSYVREKRFAEDPAVMWRQMEANRLGLGPVHTDRIPPVPRYTVWRDAAQ